MSRLEAGGPEEHDHRRCFRQGGPDAQPIEPSSRAPARRHWRRCRRKSAGAGPSRLELGRGPPERAFGHRQTRADGAAASLSPGDGERRLVNLATHNQTERAGFTAASAKPGDTIVVLGNRSKDKSQLWMKAVRITVAGKTYDLYPERIKTN